MECYGKHKISEKGSPDSSGSGHPRYTNKPSYKTYITYLETCVPLFLPKNPTAPVGFVSRTTSSGRSDSLTYMRYLLEITGAGGGSRTRMSKKLEGF
jgi:hypothetical protein